MLLGSLEYKYNDKIYKYKLKAVDNSSACSLIISSYNFDALKFEVGNNITDDNQNILEERRFDIQMSTVLIQSVISLVDGKKVKGDVNNDFFCRLGALVRYVKSSCSKDNEVGYTGMQLASGEFETSAVNDYIIKFPNTDDILAKVTLSYGDIRKLSITTDLIKLELAEDSSVETQLFPKIKDGIKVGFKLRSEEYLGFPIFESSLDTVRTLDGMYTCIEDIVAAHPDKEFSWLLKKKYILVTDDTLEEICNYIYNYEGYVYYDTETSGLNITFKSRIGQADQCVGIVLSVKYGESFFFPMQMKRIPNLCGGDHFYFMERYMRRILEGKELVAHNMAFDWKVGYIYDINCNIVHDTMAMIKLTIGAERKNYPMGLKENTKLLLGRDSLELSDLIVDNTWGETDIKFWDLPAELVRLYACADTDNTNGLLQYAIQNDLLGRYNARKVYEIEIAFSYAVAYQEFYGHHIDISNLATLREVIGKEQDNIMKQMEEIIGHEFNPNSPKQLTTILYGELGIPEQISRKTGRLTTDKETLNKLAEVTDAEDNIKYPFCALLQKFREYEGVRKIVDKFPEHVTEDGFIFSHVMQYGTTTGRVSINTPNYQSYNDPIKKNIIARDGYWMFDTDYSSVEYRVLGNMVRNERIKKSFEDPDFDYHAYQAARMYSVPYSAVNKKMRKAAKGINFGLPYGMGDESLGIRIFGEASPENTRKASALRTAYFKGQEDIRDWFEFHRDKGVNSGYTETYFGRRRYYHREDFSVNAIRRQAGNQVIQGCQSLDTRILTKEFGIVKLGDVLNLNVTVWNGIKWSNGDVLPAGNKRKTIIKFKGGQTMICSPTHKFLVAGKRGTTRWVEAQHLHTTSEYRNPHRIVVNQQYAVADYKYSSERKYDCYTNNANNVYLEDVNNSYGIGIILGRLASDGHQTLNHSGSNAVIQIIAEHEYNILPELREYMEALGFIEDDKDVREGRNEAITTLSVYSTSLSKEINDLDIRHKIHKNIFMDTEVLRGFLCGYFDGDGGISGKTITCVFGKQDNFRTLVEDMQIALSFFGVRSRIREYDDRYVLQVKTNDNDVFLEEIGFLNTYKQVKGTMLNCIEEEKTFGKCILAESVEVTDELIPMADVCNTDDGFYVADGIITHNTAADIYKLAVGRVFKRICKEGWLGKVLFSGFIHDELLGEVSNDINPAQWLKVLREEFEVKITDSDGTPWCPLYMGFGYGTSWYEAKSVELPIKFQWEFVEKYGIEGYPSWDGNGRAFCDKIPFMLRDFDIRDIKAQLLDSEAQGKEIKPTLNNQVLDCVKSDSKAYTPALNDYLQENTQEVSALGVETYLGTYEAQVCEYLNKVAFIQGLMRDSEGNIVTEFKPAKDTQEAIDQYCMLHNVDRSLINILNIQEYESNNNVDDDVEYYLESDEDLDTDKLARIIDTKIQTLGMYPDIDNKRVIALLPHPERGRQQFLTQLSNFVNKEGKGYALVFRDYWECPGDRSTTSYITSENLSAVQNLYLVYLGGRII